MSVSTFYGLQTALRGLTAQQRAIEVTGHNVANAATTGYTRQEAILGATPAYAVPGLRSNGSGAQLGSGVDVVEYRRQRSGFLDAQYRAQTTQLGAATARADALAAAEGALAEPGDGSISTALSKFWSAWDALANHPEDAAARQSLVSSARTLTDRFAAVDTQLATLAQDAADERAALTAPGGKVASLAGQLAQVNDAIRQITQRGEQPNDLLDRRDLLLDQLAQLGRVSTQLESDGTVTVGFGDAAASDPLVSGATATWPLTTLADPGGRLGALQDLASSSGTVAGYRAGLGAAADALAGAVNALHPGFFSGSGSGIAVAVTPASIVAGTGAAGANGVALAVAKLRGGTAESAYAAFVTGLASDVAGATSAQATATALQSSIDDRRQGEAGVSLDEEMTNLIRFQRAYQASSRMLSTIDETLDTLINRTGRVGL